MVWLQSCLGCLFVGWGVSVPPSLWALLPGFSFLGVSSGFGFDLRVYSVRQQSLDALCRALNCRACVCCIVRHSALMLPYSAAASAFMASPASCECDDSLPSLRRDVFEAIADLHARLDVIHSMALRAQLLHRRLVVSVEHLEFRLRVLEKTSENTDIVDSRSGDWSLHSLD